MKRTSSAITYSYFLKGDGLAKECRIAFAHDDTWTGAEISDHALDLLNEREPRLDFDRWPEEVNIVLGDFIQ